MNLLPPSPTKCSEAPFALWLINEIAIPNNHGIINFQSLHIEFAGRILKVVRRSNVFLAI